MIDIVFPNGNEEEFIKIAKKIGYDSLCFAYPLKDFFQQKKKKYDFKITYSILADDKTINKLKKTNDIVLVKSTENARNIIESNKNIIIFGLEQNNKKDFIHQKRSGLNHIMCSLATKNNIKIGLSFNSLLSASEQKRNILLGRMIDNIKLCRKYKTKVIIGSFAANPYEMRAYNDLISLFSTLSLHPSEAKSV